MGRSAFAAALADRQSDPAGRSWVYVAYDQLTDRIGPLAREDADSLGIVIVESTAKAAARPYHQQKLALVLASMRHFALEQAERGVAVRLVVTDGTYAEALAPLARELGRGRLARRLRPSHHTADGSPTPTPTTGWSSPTSSAWVRSRSAT